VSETTIPTPADAAPAATETPVDAAPAAAETPVDAAPAATETPVDAAPAATETPAAAETPVDAAPAAAETPVDAAPVATVTETPTTAPVATATTARPRRADRPIQTVGRRKEAIVRVRLMPGTGQFTLNGQPLEKYFPSKVHQQLVREPLVMTEKAEIFDVYANLRGGGTSGQAGALRLAIARALVEWEGDDRPALKKAGFLTRDARETERKKYGLKKARKAPQYSKR
jgi:small subunit ribosomal protein S9